MTNQSTLIRVALCLPLAIFSIYGFSLEIPERQGKKPEVTNGVPHKQISMRKSPKIHQELINKTFKLPGLKKAKSFTPYPEAVALWLDKSIKSPNPKSFLSRREFSHFHPDGSLHLMLSPKRAKEAVFKGWGVFHPWANTNKGWEGLVLIFTPKTSEQKEVVYSLIVDSYNFMSGRKKSP